MANNIKGITVEIGGNTAPLDKALKSVNKTSSDLQKELKQVNYQLKFDPKNTVLLEQKQKLLSDSIANTKKKLDSLKNAEKQVQAQFAKGEISEEQYRALQREVIKTESQLKNLEEQAIKSNAALSKDQAISNLKKIGKAAVGVVGGLVAVTEGTREYREDLSKLETNAKEAGSSLDVTKEALKNLNAITGETDSNVEALSNLMKAGFTDDNLASLVNDLSGAVIQFPDTLKIEGLADGLQETLATGKAIGPFSELLERMGVDLDVFNAGLADASATGEEQNYIMQELSKLGLANINEAYRKNNESLVANSDAQFAMNDALSQIGELLDPLIAGALQAFADILQSITNFITENQTVMQLMGVVIATVTALVIAFNIQQALLASGLTLWGAIASVATTVTTALGTAFAFLTSPIGLVILAIGAVIAIGVLLYKNWDKIKEKAAQLGNWLSEKWDGIKSKTSEVWNGVKDTVNSVMDAAKETVKEKLGNMKKAYEENGGGIKGIAAATMEGIKGYYSAGFTFIDKLTGGKLSKIVKSFKKGFEKAKEIVGNAIKKIKDFLNFKWKFPKLKMPHFSISGSVNPLKWASQGVPKLAVKWYKDGGIFDEPTLFNTKYGLKGVGEAGREVVAPLSKLKEMLGLDEGKQTNKETLIQGNNFYIREEADIEKVARRLYKLERQNKKGGVASV